MMFSAAFIVYLCFSYSTSPISISNNTSLLMWVSEILGIPKNISVSLCPMTDLQTHIYEQQPFFQQHTLGTVQEVENLNSNHKSNFNGNIRGDFPIEKLNKVDVTIVLGDELLENGRSTSQANLYKFSKG